MSSQRQIEANRRNSQLSTGPRTPEGKAVSRFNALKSGINAKAQVIPGEDPAELEAMTAGYHQDWQPATYLERFLVDSLVRADWLLQRLSRLEAELWIYRMEEAQTSSFNKLDASAPAGHIYSQNYDRFARLQRRIDSTERSYYRALTQLQRLRVAPAILSPVDAPIAEEVPVAQELASFSPAPPPSEVPSADHPGASRPIGFVPAPTTAPADFPRPEPSASTAAASLRRSAPARPSSPVRGPASAPPPAVSVR